MSCISRVCCQHDCTLPNSPEKAPRSIFQRIADVYLRAVQDFSQNLYYKGWVKLSLILPSLLGEPLESIKSAARRIFGWKSSWERHGFYDAGNERSLEKLRAHLKEANAKECAAPVFLLHGVFSTPDIWHSWEEKLQQTQKNGEIGCVFTMQLPNNFEDRMDVVRKAITKILTIYQEANYKTQIDLVGHSLGGYAAHVAAYHPDPEYATYSQEDKERRWHLFGPENRNPVVRKIISIAAPTWLCCKKQTDQTTDGVNADIYPRKMFTCKNPQEAYTKEQQTLIRNNHADIYDIVATNDGISAIDSPLPPGQVIKVRHTHVAAATCPKVCEVALQILAKAA